MFNPKYKRENKRKAFERSEKERLEKLRKKEKNRKRPNTIAFRMTDDEKRIFEDRQAMSGLIRQEFIIQAVTMGRIEFLGSKRAVDNILLKLDEIEMYIKNLERNSELDEVLMEELRQIVELMNNRKDS